MDKMGNHIDPLIIPARNSAPDFVQLVRLDFSVKGARNPADDQVAMHRICEIQQDGRKQQPTEMRSGYIEIGDVGRV